MQGKGGCSLTMVKHVQRHVACTDLIEHASRAFSGMNRLVDFFANEAPNFDNSKALTSTDIPMVKSYAREAYLTVTLLLICNCSIYRKLV